MTHDPYHAELLDELLKPAHVRTFWTIYVRRPSDFATVEDERSTEEEARRQAEYYYSNGYDVLVHHVMKRLLYEWTHNDTKEGE